MKKFLYVVFALFGLSALVFLTPHPALAITIGSGPVLTNSLGDAVDKRGDAWYQEFQDWTADDVRALDVNDDQYKFGDGQDTARDIIAVYSHDDGTNVFFRVDLFDSYFNSESGNLDLYAALDLAAGGQVWLPDFTDSQTDHPWEVVICVYDSSNHQVYDQTFTGHASEFQGAYFRNDLDSVEFGISRSFLVAQGWDGSSPFHIQVFTTKDLTDGGPGEIATGSDLVDANGTIVRDTGGGTGILNGGTLSTNTAGRAKYAVVAHANQSLNSISGTQDHIYEDRSDIDLHPGFIRLLDSAEMLNTPINLHISGTLLMSFMWAAQDPGETNFPARDGPTFLTRVSSFVTNGPGSKIGGVLAEHIMPYFEGEVNAKSIEQNSQLIEHMFGLTEEDMKVMHVPERVIRSHTNHPNVSADNHLDGKTFEEIENSGFTATYLDEVTHLHWWFYPNETNNVGWDDYNCGRWAGGQGNDEEPYHHKVHKINGVYTMMINDREDQSKFGNQDGGMALDTRYTLLDKAMNPDYAQVTIVFDDWEALAGNSFASPDPNNNADQFHNTLRWAANHPWIELVNLKDVVTWATNDASWVIDHGYTYDNSTETYEWLKRATEHSYDNWYYGSGLEESFFDRVPVVHWDNGTNVIPSGMKKYGDMNTTNTLIRDSWDAIQAITSTNLKSLAEWAFSCMIYETAWHDEDANPDQYKSRNYQVTFNRGVAQGNCDESVEDSTYDNLSGWAIRLHGHVRDMGVLKDASDWVERVKAGTQLDDTSAYALDIDDDTLDEYVLCNNRVYLCFERWGGRLIKAFVYDPWFNGGDARAVIGVPTANPVDEHENEWADSSRQSGFKDRYSYSMNDNRFVDMDFAHTNNPPVAGEDSWTFISKDGNIQKTITLEDGRDTALAEYTLSGAVGMLETRFGLGPNQIDLMFNGPDNLTELSDPAYRGLNNAQGGAAFVVSGRNVNFNDNPVGSGWQGREAPLVEQYEVVSTDTNYSVGLAFSLDAARDFDGDGLDNTNEWALGTDHLDRDTDNDGMFDGYEIDSGLNALADDAAGDKDGDGFDNLSEFIANTSSDDSNAFPTVTSVAFADGPAVTFDAVTDRVYSLQYLDHLPAGNWMDVTGLEQVRFSAAGYTNLSDSTPSTSRAYRVRIQLP